MTALAVVFQECFSAGSLSASDHPLAYVTHEHHNLVSIIDTANNTVVDTIPISIGYQDVAFSPDGTRAYVADGAGGRVSVIDTASRRVVGYIAVGASPARIAVSRNGKVAYVAARDLVKIDLATGEATATVLPGIADLALSPAGLFLYLGGMLGDDPSGLAVVDTSTGTTTMLLPHYFIVGVAISPDGRSVYALGRDLTGSSHSFLVIVDAVTLDVRRSVQIGEGFYGTDFFPDKVALSPDGAFAYVTVEYDRYPTVYEVNLTTLEVRSIRTDAGSVRVAFTRDGRWMYVTGGNIGVVSVVDRMSGEIVNVAAGTRPVGVAVAPGDRSVWIAATDGLYVLDAASKTIVAKMPSGSDPTGIAITSDGRSAFVANNDSGSVEVLNLETRMPVNSIRTGGKPLGVAITPDGRSAYVTSFGFPGQVYVIDTATYTQTATIDVAGPNGGIAITPDGRKVYVSDFGNHTICVIDPTTNVVTKTFHAGVVPLGITISPTAPFGYIGGYFASYAQVLDTTIDEVVTSVSFDPPVGEPCAFAFSPDGEFAYAVDHYGSYVYAIRSATKAVDWVTNLVLTYAPDSCGVAVTPDGRFVYVANHDNDAVSVVDTKTHTVVEHIPVDAAPYEVKISCLGGCPSPTPTPTDTPTPTPTGTPTPGPCFGDCDHSGVITVDELVTAVNIALGSVAPYRCPGLDSNRDGVITVDELVQAVNAALHGCY